MKRPGWSAYSKIIVLVLLSLGLFPLVANGDKYRSSVKRVRQTASKQDLATMRNAISRYTSDKLRPPQSLQDLLNEHYLREIPTDSLTGKRDWVPHFGNVEVGPGKTLYGIDDVHSSTTGTSDEDTPNNE
jgi:general secretion pathway protein G